MPKTVNFKGSPVPLAGETVRPGDAAPDFTLTKDDLSDVHLADFSGKTLVLNVFPSLDTPVCAKTVHEFNKRAAGRKNVVVACVSADLPFAHARFCQAENIENVVHLSELRSKEFGRTYGLRLGGGPLAGLLARAVLAIGPNGIVKYKQVVPEITEEPDYDEVFESIG